MALVKCTKNLSEHVLKKIDALFEARLAEAYKLRDISEKEIADLVYTLTHTQARLLAAIDLESMHVDYKLTEDSHDFRFQAMCSSQIPAATVSRNITAKFSAQKIVFKDFAQQWGAAPKVKNLPETITKPVIEAQARRDAVIRDRDEFKKAFGEAWNKVKSVNELVKLWPAVVDLLEGTDAMQRINKKTGRQKQETQSFDAASLNVQLLKAKVAK